MLRGRAGGCADALFCSRLRFALFWFAACGSWCCSCDFLSRIVAILLLRRCRTGSDSLVDESLDGVLLVVPVDGVRSLSLDVNKFGGTLPVGLSGMTALQ